MDSKFLGVGLKKAFALWVFFILMTTTAKIVFTKHHVNGVSEVIQSV